MHEQIVNYRALGVEVEPVYTPNVRKLGLATRVHRQVLEGSYDLAHVQYGSGCGFVGSLLPLPKVLTLRGSDWYGIGPRTLAERIRDAATRTLTRASLSRYDRIISVSERIRSEVAAHVSTPVDVIPSGIDLSKFVPGDRSAARATLGEQDDESPWILFSSAAEDSPVKRYSLARAAVDLLRHEYPGATIKKMTGVARSLVPTFVASCDVILLTSVHEGWPNIIKEGLACNVPFVSTDVGDLHELARRTPSCHVVEPTAEALAGALSRSLKEGHPELRHLVESMDAEETARLTTEVYRTCLRDAS